jgi:type IX secretion system PorP/SprF family membrane protein
VLVLLLVNALNAQQDPSYTLYQYNMNVINPAYVGVNGYSELNLNYRSQWANLDGSPRTQSMSFGTPVVDKMGLGLSIVNDKVFVLKQTDVYIDYSYKLKVSDSTDLYLGLKAGGTFIDIDLNSLGIMNDPVFSENVSRFNPNVGLGFYLKGKKYYANLSAPSLLKSKRYEKDGVVVTNATDELHWYAGAGYTFALSHNIELTPSILSRFVTGAPASVDLTATTRFSDLIDIGLSYRISESFSMLGLFKLSDWIQFGYAYEMTTTDVKDYSKGSHEALLRFKF